MEAEADVREDGEQRLHEVLGAYLEFADAGCAPDPEDFVAHYPELAAGLREFFGSQDRMYALAGTSTPARFDEQQTLGDYQLDRKIGGGSEGDVYKAWHKGMRKWVALKWIKAGPSASPAEVRRFRVGIEAAAKLDHPHIAPVYDVREHRGVPYFSMKLFEAGSIEKKLDSFANDPHAGAALIALVARAIHHAHQRGILHLDLKPGNILLDEHGEPHVADFGLAKRIDIARKIEDDPPPTRPMPDALTNRSTVGSLPTPIADSPSTQPYDGGDAGNESPPRATPTATMPVGPQDPTSQAFRGTVGYAPVEPSSTAADIYALGATLYRLTTGRKTYEKKEVAEYMKWYPTNDPDLPRKLNPKIDVRLEAIIMKCLRKNPAERYASADALADDLDRWLRGEPPLAWEMPKWMRAWRGVRRNMVSVAAVLVAVTAVATAAIALHMADPDRIPRQIEREARRGRVTLIGMTGPPRWSRWTLGEGTAMVSPNEDNPFSFTTLERGRLELIKRAPGTRFRLSAEVKHDKALTNDSSVGIYLGHVQHNSPGELRNEWCDLTFADEGANAMAFDGPDPNHKYARFMFAPRRQVIATQGNSLTTLEPPVQKLFLSAQSRKVRNEWRRLAIDVTPEKIQAFWESEALPELSMAELRQLSQPLVGANEVKSPGFEFDLRGGLGLLVIKGKASFRQVTIEPLD